MAKLNDRGHEILDNTPIEIPLGWRKPESLTEQMRRLIRTEMSIRAQDQGFETFEEADDFDVDEDDPLPQSEWEMTYEPEGNDPELGASGSNDPGPTAGEPGAAAPGNPSAGEAAPPSSQPAPNGAAAPGAPAPSA